MFTLYVVLVLNQIGMVSLSFSHTFPIVPIALLWLAIDRRISAYAWTEQRIYLVALALAITMAYAILIIPKNSPISFDFCRCNGGHFCHDLGGETKRNRLSKPNGTF